MIIKRPNGKWRVQVKYRSRVVADRTFDRRGDAARWEVEQKRLQNKLLQQELEAAKLRNSPTLTKCQADLSDSVEARGNASDALAAELSKDASLEANVKELTAKNEELAKKLQELQSAAADTLSAATPGRSARRKPAKALSRSMVRRNSAPIPPPVWS